MKIVEGNIDDLVSLQDLPMNYFFHSPPHTQEKLLQIKFWFLVRHKWFRRPTDILSTVYCTERNNHIISSQYMHQEKLIINQRMQGNTGHDSKMPLFYTKLMQNPMIHLSTETFLVVFRF